MAKGWIILAAVVLALTPAAGAQALEGNWMGLVMQVDGPTDQHTYMVEITLDGRGGGRVSYPSFPCSGELQRLRVSANSEFYRETIASNGSDCVSGGEITLTRQGRERVIFVWDGRPAGAPEISAVAVLFEVVTAYQEVLPGSPDP